MCSSGVASWRLGKELLLLRLPDQQVSSWNARPFVRVAALGLHVASTLEPFAAISSGPQSIFGRDPLRSVVSMSPLQAKLRVDLAWKVDVLCASACEGKKLRMCPGRWP